MSPKSGGYRIRTDDPLLAKHNIYDPRLFPVFPIIALIYYNLAFYVSTLGKIYWVISRFVPNFSANLVQIL